MSTPSELGIGYRGLRRRLRQLPRAASRLRHHPDWLLDNARLLLPRRRQAKLNFNLEELGIPLVTPREAVVDVLGVTGEDFDRALADTPRPALATGTTAAVWDARVELLDVVTSITRLLQPITQVETGVARGYSTAVTLEAMHRNGRGHLHSLDLPPLVVDPNEFVGQVIPEHLKARWTLQIGPSRQTLPGLVERVAPIDVFLHDSDHTYESQIFEYRTAWPHLRPGGVLLSDDVGNRALTDFAAEVGARASVVRKQGKRTGVGLIRKPG